MCLYSDREKLRQILKNFLSNAAKFTDQGRVVLEAAWRAQSDRPLVLSVADTGIGIPADKQEVIFEAFQQADGSTRRRYGGTGLGLSISRELAGLLGGWITVQSEEGRGSRFTLTMPIKHDPKYLTGRWALAEKAVKTEPSAGARRVDIREFPVQQRGPSAPEPSEQRLESLRGQGAVDKPLAGHWALLLEREVRDLVAETALLESLGLRVQTAADADEALDTLSEEEECALVLVAALVSIENTCDTIRKIRADERYNNLEIVVMGVPAGSSEGDRLKQAGADGFCTKPLGQNDILSLVDAGPAASPEHIRQQTA